MVEQVSQIQMESSSISTQSVIDVSIVIPAYNEAQRLPKFLEKVTAYIRESGLNVEVIVVDDGSSDETVQTANRFRKPFTNFSVISLMENRGKGEAVKTGLWQAKGRAVVFMDADGSTPPEEINKALPLLEKGYDIVIGSRVLTDDEQVLEVKAHRKWIGKTFNWLTKKILTWDICDSQCGFKVFRRDLIKPLFAKTFIHRYGFDLEILYLAHRMGCRIKEIPVTWHSVTGSKVNLLTDSIRMFFNMLQIRYVHNCSDVKPVEHMSEEEIRLMDANEQAHWWFRSKNALIKSLTMNIKKTDRILDVGSGTGLNALALSQFGQVIATDISGEALRLAQKKDVRIALQTNSQQLSFKNASVNLATALDVIEHVEDPVAVLKEMYRVLEPGGSVIITVPAYMALWGEHDVALSHLRRYNKKELTYQLEVAGFKVDRAGYYFMATFPAVAAIRILKRLIKMKPKPQSDTSSVPSGFINSTLVKIFAFEAKLAAKFSLPFGSTVFAVAHKE